MQNLMFVGAVGVFVGAIVWIAGHYYARALRPQAYGWEELCGRLAAIDRRNIAQVALDLIDESGEPRLNAANLQAEQIWELTGGLDGLEILETNSEILIELAFYVQRWYPEAASIAERMRLDARELNWHVNRLRGAAQAGNLHISFPFYAQRAVATYYLMTRRLLRLYEAADFTMMAKLNQAL